MTVMDFSEQCGAVKTKRQRLIFFARNRSFDLNQR
jgi:hypothetical protein